MCWTVHTACQNHVRYKMACPYWLHQLPCPWHRLGFQLLSGLLVMTDRTNPELELVQIRGRVIVVRKKLGHKNSRNCNWIRIESFHNFVSHRVAYWELVAFLLNQYVGGETMTLDDIIWSFDFHEMEYGLGGEFDHKYSGGIVLIQYGLRPLTVASTLINSCFFWKKATVRSESFFVCDPKKCSVQFPT